MENTLENKAKFCALYWGQKVVKYNDIFEEATHVDFVDFIDMKDKAFLELKPLSSISDEDFNKLRNVSGYIIENKVVNIEGNSVTIYFKWTDEDFKDGFGHSESTIYYDSFSQLETDFLRSKGYALPYMYLSVEELVRRGWIKLKVN